MSCCGKARRMFGSTSTASAPRPAPLSAPTSTLRFAVIFEYAGRTGLTATGPVSGKHYRFDSPGARLQVDPRDRPGLAKVPTLRQV